jgi:3-dehydroquinate dehydratase II
MDVPKTVWVVNGPNLNLLGTREPTLYGHETLQEIEAALIAHGQRHGVRVECFQSNCEGDLVSRVQAAPGQADALVLNPGAYTHTSIALRDALAAVALPAIEVHLTNLYGREAFRRRSYVGQVCQGSISGFGSLGYHLALDAVLGYERAHDGEGGR